jgi:hypothetical protein
VHKVSRNPAELRSRLLEEYARATKRYRQAVAELSGRRAITSEQSNDAVYHDVVDARNDCDRLRKSLSETNSLLIR